MTLRVTPRPDGRICVALYARTCEDDRGKRGNSYFSHKQMSELESYCTPYGWDIVGRFSDNDHSGGNTDRPGYKEMMDTLREKRKKFISLQEDFDTRTAMGRFSMDMIQRTAQLECELYDERKCKNGIRIDLRSDGGKVFDLLPNDRDEYNAVIDYLDFPVNIKASSIFKNDEKREVRNFSVEVDGRYYEWEMEDNDHMGSSISEVVWLLGTGMELGRIREGRLLFTGEGDLMQPFAIDLKYIGEVKFSPPDDVDASRFVRSERFDCYGHDLVITVFERPTKECPSEGYFSIQLEVSGWKTINEKVNTSDIGVSLNEDGIKKAVQHVWDKWWKAGVIWY